MKIESNFENNGKIADKYGCKGENINPKLIISEIPNTTKTIALIVDDPDAPSKTWVHWVVFNIPISGDSLEIREGEIPKGIEGINDFGNINYGGPCPPSGTHHYFFKIYALDSELNLIEGATKEQLEEEMKRHIIDRAELVGLYSRD